MTRTNERNDFPGAIPNETGDGALCTEPCLPAPGRTGEAAATGHAPDPAQARLAGLQEVTRRQLELIGEDPEREGLRETPARVAKALSWLTRGYAVDPRQAVGDAIFEEEHRGMVVVRDVEMFSMCEHHLLPLFGKVHLAYLPAGRIIGLSKLPRLVEVFARRLQVQERLTQQVAEAVEDVLQPRGVAVMVEAVHLCMMMRGVEKQGSSTVTTTFRGAFEADAGLREEFFRLTSASSGR